MNRALLRGIASIALCLVSGLAMATDTADVDRPLAFGEQPAHFTFTDTRFLPRTLSDLGEKKAYVIVFTTLDCPVVKRSLPRLKELEAQLRERDVQFLALNVGVNQPVTEVAFQALKAEIPFPAGKDFDGSAARALGASRTPEVVVLDSERRLRYRGRIDGQIRRGGIASAAQRADLLEAIQDVLSGKEVRVRETPVDGCPIDFDGLRSLPAPVPEQVTYSEQIAPLLEKHCQHCHRPDTAAPFSLLSYTDAASHAETIAEVVRIGQMPPIYSAREHGEFRNHQRLTPQEQALVLAWVRQGRNEGEPAAEPTTHVAAPASKWRIGEPDLVIPTILETKIPATGVVPYHYAILPHVFWKDTWVQGIEILPGNRSVMHHCNLGFLQPGEAVTRNNFITGYVPGGEAMNLTPGVGFCIPAGSVLVMQMHYVTNGERTTDRTSVGIRFARDVIQKRLRYFDCVNHDIAIPPGDPHFPLSASRHFPCNATGYAMFGHMHLRGKDMTFTAHHPDGTQETLLSIPNYDFNWQMAYRWKEGAQRFPKGTRVEVVAHFDNSAFNPYNPDHTVTVKEGQQSFDEMMYGFLFYSNDDEQLNLTISPRDGTVIE